MAWRALAWCLAGWFWLGWTHPAAAQGKLEYEVKAVFLLNFTKFVDWPPGAFADAGSPIAICILGKDPFRQILDETVAGESVNGRKLTVQRLTQPPGARQCQVVLVAGNEKTRAANPQSFPTGVLTVGEGESFAHDGGIIAFVIDNRRVRFDINRSAAERSSLKLSSRLLSVARSVE